jgi:chromosome partitioning protein
MAYQKDSNMRVYAVCIEKGGTGKSAVSVHLAVAFVQRGLRVLLIDLDAQGHASRWLGVHPTAVRPENSILGIIRGRTLGEGAMQTDEGVDVLPAHPEMSGLPVALASAPNNGLFVLKQAISNLDRDKANYDVIVCDLPPARSPILATALAAATRCLAPVQPEDLVLQALAELMTSVRYAQQVNPGLPDVNIIRNRYAPRSAVDGVYDETLRTRYGNQLLETIIPVRAAIRESAGFQQSVFHYSSSDATEVRNRFLQLADELLHLDGVA